MNELAIALVEDKPSFVTILRDAKINADVNESDLSLIDKFVRHAPYNRKLLLDASLLINFRNREINADGESEISDDGVKATYTNLVEYFDGVPDEEKSNWIGAVAGLAGKALGINKRQASQSETQQNAQRQAEMKMQAQLLAQRRAAQLRLAAEKEKKRKKTQRIIITTTVIISIVVVGLIIYKNKSK
jgi:predicted RND superfamily exporter protein